MSTNAIKQRVVLPGGLVTLTVAERDALVESSALLLEALEQASGMAEDALRCLQEIAGAPDLPGARGMLLGVMDRARHAIKAARGESNG